MSETTELTQFTNSMAVLDNRFDEALEAAVVVEAEPVQYLRVHQERSSTPGLIAFGMDQTPVDPDSEWAVNPFDLRHGWILRDGGKVLDRNLVPIFKPVPRGPFGSKPAVSGNMKCTTDHHKGVQVEFSGDADYAKKFFGRCINAIRKQRIDNPGTKDVVPVIRLEVKPYPNPKDDGNVYPMIPHVMYWRGIDVVAPDTEAESAAPVVETAPQEATTRRRRVNVSEEL